MRVVFDSLSPGRRSVVRVTVSHYSERRPRDPEVMVELTVDGSRPATGFIDARQQRDGAWEAYVDYSYTADNGFPSHRRGWFPMADLIVLTIDDVSQGGYTVPVRPVA